jgi:hypothetical protein
MAAARIEAEKESWVVDKFALKCGAEGSDYELKARENTAAQLDDRP